MGGKSHRRRMSQHTKSVCPPSSSSSHHQPCKQGRLDDMQGHSLGKTPWARYSLGYTAPCTGVRPFTKRSCALARAFRSGPGTKLSQLAQLSHTGIRSTTCQWAGPPPHELCSQNVLELSADNYHRCTGTTRAGWFWSALPCVPTGVRFMQHCMLLWLLLCLCRVLIHEFWDGTHPVAE